MKNQKFILSVGVWLMVLPFLGVPLLWKTFLMIGTGLVLCYNSYLLVKRPAATASIARKRRRVVVTNSYVENSGPAVNSTHQHETPLQL